MASPQRILLTTFGSLGDLHPYLALALELRRRGFRPVVGSIEYHRARVEREGIEFRRIRSALMDEADSTLIKRLFHPRKGIEMLVRELIMPALQVAYEDTLIAAEGASLLVAHPLTFTTRTAARVLKLPWVSTQLAPIGLLSVFDPPVLPAAPFLTSLAVFGPSFFSRVVAVGKRSIRSWTEPYAQFNRRLGLPTPQDPFFDEHSPLLELAMFSDLLGAKQPDWPPQTVTTGFAFYDGGEDAHLSNDIEEFLQAGEPPIVFTLGSSAVMDAGRFYHESAEAARMLGRRAILLTGSEAVNRPASLPAGVAAFDYAPFSLLFPRAAALVHQGGVGTTAQAMRSGRPMLVMPYAFDQQDNAARVRKLGIARVVKRSQYSARRAARELAYLIDTDDVRRQAAQVGQRIAHENGASCACDKLEELLAH